MIRSAATRMIRPTGDNPLTTQHDFKTDYRSRRITRRRRIQFRRAKRFTARVARAHTSLTTYPKHVLRTQRFTRTCTQNAQNYFGVLLHTVDGIAVGNGGNEQADWREFFREGGGSFAQAWDNANTVLPGVGLGLINRAIRSIRATIEVTLRNTGTNPLILNAYRIYCKRNVRSNFDSIENVYRTGFFTAEQIEANPENNTGLWDSRIIDTDIGSTCFQSRVFCQHFKIVRRTKYQLSPGEEVQLTYTDRRSRNLSQRFLQGNSFVRNLTTGWFIEFNGVPSSGAPPVFETTNAPAQLACIIHKRYSILMLPQKVEQSSNDVPDV